MSKKIQGERFFTELAAGNNPTPHLHWSTMETTFQNIQNIHGNYAFNFSTSNIYITVSVSLNESSCISPDLLKFHCCQPSLAHHFLILPERAEYKSDFIPNLRKQQFEDCADCRGCGFWFQCSLEPTEPCKFREFSLSGFLFLLFTCFWVVCARFSFIFC